MRKAYVVMLSCCLLVAGAAAAQAAETTTLGNANVAVKLDSLHFTASEMRESDADTATYVGLEAYGIVAPNLYLGGEVGHAESKGSVINIEVGRINTEVTFVPVEVNLKYVAGAGQHVSIGFGGGLSYNYYRYQAKAGAPFLLFTEEISDWVVGGQLFADMNFAFGPVSIGVNGKVQVVAMGDNINNSGTVSYDEYSSWRAGGQIGMRF